jgi:hypothetical protein
MRTGMGKHRYGAVLLLILCSLVFQLAAPERGWAHLVIIALQGLAFLAALVASRAHPYLRRAAIVVVAIAVVSSAAALIGFGELSSTATRIVTLLFVALTPVTIARGVIVELRERGVSLHTMYGVLCIYLLIGSLFAFLFGIVGDLASTPFFGHRVSAHTTDYLYFSFTTITTVGYGDLVAVTDLGRSLAIAEALLGQIYLVTVVAVIVGGLSRQPA